MRQFHSFLVVLVAVAAIVPYVPVASAAANTMLEVESMAISPAGAGKVAADSSASGGSALFFHSEFVCL